MARLVARWVRLYTWRLPAPVARRRIQEIDADLHDHITHERAHGTRDRSIALSIASRMVRGVAGDASWRARARPRKGHFMKLFAAVLAIAIGVAAILYGNADDAPGLVLIGLVFVAGAVVLGVRIVQRR